MDQTLIPNICVVNEVSEMSVETCGVCYYHIMDRCTHCHDSKNLTEKCGISWGKCGHVFHTHCIAKGQNEDKVCPLDNQKWEDQQNKLRVLKK